MAGRRGLFKGFVGEMDDVDAICVMAVLYSVGRMRRRDKDIEGERLDTLDD